MLMATDTEPGTPEADLTYPERSWSGFFKEHFGPSMLWALISIGGSHIVLAPTLGGFFGLFAVWIFVFIYLVKYGGWELGIRYNYGVGGNPIEAYTDLPGPKNWALWLTALIFTVFYTGITASVAASTTALAMVVSPLSFIQTYAVLVGVAAVLVLVSRYSLLEKVLLVFTVSLGVLLVIGVLVGPPSTDVIAETTFNVPDLTGALFVGLFAAAAGFAPTGFSTSILIGSWSMAKEGGTSELRERGLDPEDERYHDYIRQWIRTGRRDFNIGYGFSLILAIAMIVLASNVLYPEPPTDENLAVALGNILTESFGPWSFWAMLLGAFAALYSTVITLLDGASRATSDILPMALEGRTVDTELVRRTVIAGMALGSVVPLILIGELPVTLIVWIAAILAMVEVFFYPANWYVVEKNLPEAFRPSTTWKVYYVVAIALVFLFGVMGALETFNVIGV
ncbi:divalent metal cation transporter [Halorubrum sp. 48-1-W]|nr:divalent metal cation transporter [Halorubrum sp. 48-1-W]